MLYRLRSEQGTADFGLGTLVAADGSVRRLTQSDWRWDPLATWKSPETGAAYPVRWRLRVPAADLDLEIAARLEAQENVSERSAMRYWEGAVTAAPVGDGGPRGFGYVELTGYGEGNRPPL
jgi:predicted secreted hydrolase